MCVTSHQEICARFRLTSNFIFFFKSVNYAAGRATEMWRVVGRIKLIQLSPWVWIQPTVCDARKNMFFFPFPYSFMSHCKNPSSSGCWWRARGWGCCPRCWTTSLKHGLYLYPTPPSSHTGEFPKMQLRYHFHKGHQTSAVLESRRCIPVQLSYPQFPARGL